MAKTRRRKKRTHVEEAPDPSKKPDPRTFVFRRGKHANLLADLEMDIRKMMMPNTAINLKESKRNMLRDFVQVAGPLGVTHFIMLTATESSNYMRVAKTPRGPTLALRIKGYSLARDVQAAQTRPRVPKNAFQTAPLVVLNGFGGSANSPQPEHLKLATVLLQAMFPPINVNKVKLSTCQRVVLMTHDKNTGTISLRHYSISVVPSGIRKSLKTLLQHKALPKMGEFQDVSEFVMKSGYGSESEGEDAEASRVTLAQDLGKGNAAGRTSRVRLHEIGPRLELEMVKIEEGLCEGRVMYHAHVAKTPEEAAALQQHHESKGALKAQRKMQQEANVRRKRLEAARKEAEKAAEAARKSGKLPPQSQKKQWWEDELDAAGDEAEQGEGKGVKRQRPQGDDEDDDLQYFREEVGHDPDASEMIGRKSTSFGRGKSMKGGAAGFKRKGKPSGDKGGGGKQQQGNGKDKGGFKGKEQRGGGQGGRGGKPNKKQKRK